MATNKEVIVITGSSGRIGSRLIEKFGKDYQCVALDFVKPKEPQAADFIFVDLSSDESVEKAFQEIRNKFGNHLLAVIHLAAFYSFTGEHLENYEKITVKGTERILTQAKKFEVEQFIFTSTMLVHNPTERGVITDENAPIEGKWHYPASKVRTEKVLHEQHGNIPLVIIRIAGCYDDHCNCIPISQHISRIYEKQFVSYLFPGDKTHGVPYIHFDDVSEMVSIIISKRKTLPKELTLLCAEEDSMSQEELQEEIAHMLYNKSWPMIEIPKAVARFGAWAQNLVPFGPPPFIKPWMVDLADDNYEISMHKSREVLQWAPKHKLRSTLPAIIKDFKANPEAWYKRHGIPFKGVKST